MLRPLLGYCRGSGCTTISTGLPAMAARWFRTSMRSTSGRWPPTPLSCSRCWTRKDVVILHDPQTAGLAEPAKRTGATVIWRCHVGLDQANDVARDAWRFLLGYVLPAHAYVFSRAGFAWEVVAPRADLGDQAVDRCFLAQERRAVAGDVAGDPGTDGHRSASHERPCDVHSGRRVARAGPPSRGAVRTRAGHARGQTGDADFALGPSQRPARSHERICQARSRIGRRPSAPRRPFQ